MLKITRLPDVLDPSKNNDSKPASSKNHNSKLVFGKNNSNCEIIIFAIGGNSGKKPQC